MERGDVANAYGSQWAQTLSSMSRSRRPFAVEWLPHYIRYAPPPPNSPAQFNLFGDSDEASTRCAHDRDGVRDDCGADATAYLVPGCSHRPERRSRAGWNSHASTAAFRCAYRWDRAVR